MSEKRTVIEDYGENFGFRVQWSVSDTLADFVAYEIASRTHESDGYKPFFLQKDWQSSDQQTEDIAVAAVYASGFIKWDGCSEMEFPDVHWCGAYDFKKHIALLERLYRRAGELMSKADLPPW